MTSSNLIPVAMDRAQLGAVFADIAQRVAAGDSFEGNIQYAMPIDDWPQGKPEGWPSTECEFWVTGVYRIGNLQGQGGIRMIGTVPSRPEGA